MLPKTKLKAVQACACMCLCFSTCVCSGQGAKDAGVLRRSIINLHDVIQSCLEEGELTEDH